MPDKVISYKFGKKAPKRSLRTLHFGNYGVASKIPFPQKVAWERAEISSDALGNMEYGDCAEAAPARAIMNMTMVANWTKPTVIVTAQVLKAYADITGFDPAKPETDAGTNMLDVCSYMKYTGIADFTFDGYVQLDTQNIDQIRAAIWTFGWVYAGMNVPTKLIASLNRGTVPDVWRFDELGADVSGEGHAIGMFGYGRYGMGFNSWGQWLHMDNDFWLNNVDEAYAFVSKAWLKQSGVSPSGFDYQGLLNDLQLV